MCGNHLDSLLDLSLHIQSVELPFNMPPEKRKRIDGESDESDSSEPVRSDIWFDDGNIIIQAENTQFRLYKGLLCNASESEVLKAAIRNIGDSKGVDGCPLLCLSDSSLELSYVFKSIFYRW